MAKIKKAIAACVLFAAALSAIAKQEIDVAAYIWPAYQNEPRWAELGIFKDGCGEWQNVYQARPKRPWHNQPVEPLWGYGRDDDPVEMSRQIDAALAAGINVFIYDWYWYGGRPFLENALNNGFLKAPNNSRMKFYLMWANHDVNGLWDNTIGAEKKGKVIWNADVGLDEFKKKLVPWATVLSWAYTSLGTSRAEWAAGRTSRRPLTSCAPSRRRRALPESI